MPEQEVAQEAQPHAVRPDGDGEGVFFVVNFVDAGELGSPVVFFVFDRAGASDTCKGFRGFCSFEEGCSIVKRCFVSCIDIHNTFIFSFH